MISCVHSTTMAGYFGTRFDRRPKGEKVTLPIGPFEVLEHTRPPLRRWFLGRVRVMYAQRKYVKFTPAAGRRGNRWVCCLSAT